MKKDALKALDTVIESAHENEIIEFKGGKSLDKDSLGRYFSALSNEARLKNVDSAWLFFGITDKGEICGTDYLDTVESINDKKRYVSENTTGGLSFVDIYEERRDGKRILIFEIPAAKIGVPTAFKRIAYERQGDSVMGLSDDKRIRLMQASIPDWSKTIVRGATVEESLSSEAIGIARKTFQKNYPSKLEECVSWDDVTFLNKMGLTVEGKVTYAAIVLLGKPESEHLVPDSVLKIRWILREEDHSTVDNEIFGIPFIAAIDKICGKIRNVKYEYFSPNTLFPDRMDTYDSALLREMLNNCVAHQDYRKGEYITVTEYDRDRLIFKNAGVFIPGSLENVISSNSPTSYYRNRTLAEAMRNLGMVDIAGGGILRAFKSQMQRYFPMPEYNLSDEHVEVAIYGKVMDKKFAEVLSKNPKLRLSDVILLDRVQKKKPLTDDEAKYLKRKKFISGRKPIFYISSSLAETTNNAEMKAQAIKEKGFDDGYYKDLIVEYVKEYGSGTKQEFRQLLNDKLPDSLTETQKYNKVTNLLSALTRSGRLINEGTLRCPVYVINENN